MIEYNKDEIKEELTIENIYDLLSEFGGEPVYNRIGLISGTICHNAPGIGSHKLYYYENSHLFHCFTGCADPSFDIFELIIKVKKIQAHQDWNLPKAVAYVAQRFNLKGHIFNTDDFGATSLDWKILDSYKEPEVKFIDTSILLPEYDKIILTRFSYPRIDRWEKEGIKDVISKRNFIGYYPGDEQITIPHYDKQGRLIGIRGRYLVQEDADRFGKYRPLYLNGVLYNHPLRMNLYNLNNSKENIEKMKVAIVFESEKSCLQYQSIYGHKNDISVAMCGSSLSEFQVKLLLDLGIKEIIVALDRQFINIGDLEFQHLKNNILKINEKFCNYTKLSFIFDKEMITNYKASPIDEGKEKFEILLKSRLNL